MENKRFVKYLFLGVLLITPIYSSAYNTTTHASLTEEVVKFFNHSFPTRQINSEDAEAVIKGSIDEDSGTRWLHHFYDPVHQRGLTLGKEGDNPNFAFIGGAPIQSQWASSKEWAGSTNLQRGITGIFHANIFKGYFADNEDYSWERGIYEYAWGDKTRGLKTLGHILHLLEDASVPDHTRNDPHPALGKRTGIALLENNHTTNASPYESFAIFPRGSIDIATTLNDRQPILLNSIGEYFDSMARYSNNNFFSGDTIFSKEYERPTVDFYESVKLSNGSTAQFGYVKIDVDSQKIVRVENGFDWNEIIRGKNTQKYFLTDDNNLILSSYFTLLSRSAVLHGSGLVKLFFDSVNEEKKTKVLYRRNKSWLAQKIDGFRNGTFAVAGALYGSSVSKADLEDETDTDNTGITGVQPLYARETHRGQTDNNTGTNNTRITGVQSLRATTPNLVSKKETKFESAAKNSARISAPADTSSAAAQKPGNSQLGNSVSKLGAQAPNPDSSPTPIPSPTPKSASKSRDTSSSVPIAGGGGSTPAAAAGASADTTAPSAPVIAAPSSDGATATSTSISFTGTAEASAVISNDFSSATSTADSAGNWTLSVSSLAQGTSTIRFFAKDAAGNTSTGSSRSVFVDSIAPSFTLTITECSSSLAVSGCLIAATTISLSWPSTAEDLSYYSITCETNGAACSGFSFAATTATSTTYTAPTDNTIYTFRATATDTHGAVSAEQALSVSVATRPVVINEIAWAGTSSAHPNDEWMELYNPTDKDISLSNWILRSSTDNTPYVSLTGTIASKGYFLLEWTDDNTISDIAASQTYTGALNNTGETLELSHSSTTMDKTPSPCGNFWCLGSQYNTMERYDPLASGTTTANWASYAGMLGNGKNADNADVTGTPGKRNSVNYFPDPSGSSLSQSKTLSKTNNPYVIPDTAFTVQSGATLTVDPGVVIKFHNTNSALVINGAISAAGTASLPIVFTSFHDDDCGISGGCGDTNAATTSPAAGDWGSVKISSSAANALFDHTTIRYGGINDFSANYYANVRIENASTTVKNSTIEKSKYYGIYVKNAGEGTIASNTIKNNADSGLFVSSSTPVITGNTLTENKQGLVLQINSNSAVSDNTFTQNTNEAMVADGSYPTLSGNTASSNGTNAVQISGTCARDYTLSTDIPWLIATAFVIPSGKTLTAPAGAVIKFKDNNSSSLSVQGKLLAQGTSASKAVFTSIRDDGYGGDTNNDGSATSPAAGNWLRINFTNGGATSTLAHAIIRYGGTSSSLDSNIGAVRVENASIELQNSVIESNYTAGLWLKNSTSTAITDSTIQNHRDPSSGQSYGIFMTNSSPSIKNTLFKNNTTAILDNGGSSVINLGDITFDGNTTDDNPSSLIP